VIRCGRVQCVGKVLLWDGSCEGRKDVELSGQKLGAGKGASKQPSFARKGPDLTPCNISWIGLEVRSSIVRGAHQADPAQERQLGT